MRPDLEQIELIEKYLLGTLAGEDKLALEERIKTDICFRESVEMQKLLVEAVHYSGLKSELNQYHEMIYGDNPGKISAKWTKWLIGTISLSLVIIGLFFYLKNSKDEVSIPSSTFVVNNDQEKNKFDLTEGVLEDLTVKNFGAKKRSPAYTVLEGSKNPIIDALLPSVTFDRVPLFKDSLKALYYNLLPYRDTIIKGSKGLKIFFPVNSFLTPEGKEVNSPIRIEIKECNSISSVIKSGLSVGYDQKVFPPSHMIYFRAFSEGKELKINPEKPIRVVLPFKDSSLVLNLDEKKGNWEVVNYSFDEYEMRKMFVAQGEKRLIPIPTDVLDYDIVYSETFGDKTINSKVETLLNPEYENTFVASIQFHKRIEGSLFYSTGTELLDIYLSNTSKKLWEVDSMVAQYLHLKALNDCKQYSFFRSGEEYFSWLASERYASMAKLIKPIENNFQKGRLYNNMQSARRITSLKESGLTDAEANGVVEYFKMSYFLKTQFREAKKNNSSLAYYYVSDGDFVLEKKNRCTSADFTGVQNVASVQKKDIYITKPGWWMVGGNHSHKTLSLIITSDQSELNSSSKVFLYSRSNNISIEGYVQKGSSLFNNLPAEISDWEVIAETYLKGKHYVAKKKIGLINSKNIKLEFLDSDQPLMTLLGD
jgi:hypothetical protein